MRKALAASRCSGNAASRPLPLQHPPRPDLLLSSLKGQVYQALKKKNTSNVPFLLPFTTLFRVKCI